MKREYLTFAEILTMHRLLIDHYGGCSGLRDPGALEAALFRPQSGYYKDILEEAAALWESLVINHPFIDGNKRIGFAAADTFLQINGYKITAEADKLYSWIINLMENNIFTFENILDFLKENTIKL